MGERRPIRGAHRRRSRRYFSRVRRWLRPPRRFSPTRAGWVFFALTFGVGFAALVWVFRIRSFKEVIAQGREARSAENNQEAATAEA